MQLNNLTKVTDRSKKRLGRGLGSGKGKTGGRGQKGQKARGKVPAANVGAGLILYKKLPYKRGWNRTGGNPARSPKPVILTLDKLNEFKAGEVVNYASIIEKGFATDRSLQKRGVKILFKGEVTKALTVEIPVSVSCKEQIEKAGGKVVI